MVKRAKIGQLVRLRAGGPVLSVTQEYLLDDGSYSYWCQWFEQETLRNSTFPIVALEPVEGEFEVDIEVQLGAEAKADAESKADSEERKDDKKYH
ncbi:DUF2158 domain-containing protein [Endozoicomonas sp. SCSIO W0465]|uniref:DUF2158 domain-containing protein n=1 Tax=Endozoicomonas sp. SCSIO W0465 TaxID=2918516 RepID=UPI002075FC79|nr:DUF2158 domain-containing protein [Endozoicomonas sp. SCSIO W0465]USE37923.1 DUF2158 domain-containing protein [Endozoicomonas sp. SCSIO W0465]